MVDVDVDGDGDVKERLSSKQAISKSAMAVKSNKREEAAGLIRAVVQLVTRPPVGSIFRDRGWDIPYTMYVT